MIVKSLSRGLTVLSAVNQYRPATVKQLVHRTGLPKPTLIRLLQSLVAEGYVKNAADSAGYQVGAGARRLSSGLEHSRYTEIALPHLKSLSENIKFPGYLHLRDGKNMWLETSARLTAPIQLPIFGLDRAPMLESAVGNAYLAALPEFESNLLIAELSKDGDSTERNTNYAKAVNAIELARTRGYSRFQHSEILKDLEALAMPVSENGQVIGAVSVVVLSDIISESLVRDRLIPGMRLCVQNIEADLDKATPTASLNIDVSASDQSRNNGKTKQTMTGP